MSTIDEDGAVEVRGTGLEQHVPVEAADDMDARLEARIGAAVRTGSHLWTTVAMWEVNPSEVLAGESPHLTADALLTFPRIGCYLCETPFSKSAMHRRCKPVKR